MRDREGNCGIPIIDSLLSSPTMRFGIPSRYRPTRHANIETEPRSVGRSLKNRGSAHAPSGEATDGGPRLAAMQDSIASQVLPAAPRVRCIRRTGGQGSNVYVGRETTDGHPGLERSRIAQLNGRTRIARSKESEAQWVHGDPNGNHVSFPRKRSNRLLCAVVTTIGFVPSND
jgi:hypothetical protein